MLFGIENIYPKAWGRAAGSGSGYGFKRNCKEPAFTEYEVKQNVTLLSDISAGQCMFRRYVFFYCKNMDGTEGRSWDIPIQKRKNTGGNRTAASSEGTAGFFTENVVP